MAQKELKEELRQISARYYAQPLRDAGFQNYRDDLLNWYKIYNGIICHYHVMLTFPYSMSGICFEWWFHPTYIAATINMPLASTQFDEPLQRYLSLAGSMGAAPLPGGEILVPKLPKRGAEYIYEELLPQVVKMQTREAVYENLRNLVVSRWKHTNCEYPLSAEITSDFADQALMMHDTEMFPHCVQALEKREIPNVIREKLSKTSMIWRSTELLEAQLKALKGIEVEAYMELLKERKEKFLKKYKLQDKDFDL